ncbi:MAG: glycosyltransferase [Paeniclostridium sordellii]|nr:glycosyltransferase [Paeniclostridium sordellii]
MKYSVLMTVYKNDNPNFLEKSIMSMINQSVQPDELVLVKDGPITNDLQIVIDNIDEKFPNIIKQVQLKKNVGLGCALNEGLKICKNNIVARMDADDISLKNRCELQLIEFINNSDLDIVGSYVDEFIENEKNIICTRKVPLSNDEIYKFAKQRDPFNHPAVMYKKSTVLKCGGYSDLRKNQDTDLWIKMIMNNCNAKNIDKSLLLFRFDERTYERRKNWVNTKLLIKIRYKAYKNGFGSIKDLLNVAIIQSLVYVMPIQFQKWIYSKFLRSKTK